MKRNLASTLAALAAPSASLALAAGAALLLAERPARAIPAPPQAAPARIRVRLTEAAPKIRVRGYDLRFYERATAEPDERRPAALADRASEWELRCQAAERGRPARILAVPVSGASARPMVLAEPVAVRSPAGFLTYRGRPYREELRLYAVGRLCEVVNEVGLEKYLEGLVNAEFSSKWSEASIAAQVVAARTYALYQIRQAKADPDRARFDVDATVRDQVYDGSMREDFRASRTVERTRGLVLTTGPADRPAPLKAFYHSTCGGSTELPEHVWGKAFTGFSHPVRCPFCGGSPRFRWELDLRGDEVATALLRGARADGAQPGWPKRWLETVRDGKLLDLRAGPVDAEGREASVTTVWASGGQAVELRVKGARFRDWMGPARFRSTAFQVLAHQAADGKRWRFEGRGNGHGVGMCQWGAKTMGERGYDMAAILHYYYPDAVLRKLW